MAFFCKGRWLGPIGVASGYTGCTCSPRARTIFGRNLWRYTSARIFFWNEIVFSQLAVRQRDGPY